MNKENCGNCLSWRRNPDLPGTRGSGSSPNAMGTCRYNEPTIDGWPACSWKEWCGKHLKLT